MDKKQVEEIRQKTRVRLEAAYPKGHMPIADAAKEIGINPRKLEEYGIQKFLYGNRKHCRIELVLDAMLEHQGVV